MAIADVNTHLDACFERAGVSRDALRTALLSMCPKALKGGTAEETQKMRDEWTRENPTRFCCYFVSEMVYWFIAPTGSVAMALALPGERSLHRYVLWPNGSIVDLTCDQFGAGFDLASYRFGKRRAFLQTGGPGPSLRARQLAALLGKHEVVHKHGELV